MSHGAMWLGNEQLTVAPKGDAFRIAVEVTAGSLSCEIQCRTPEQMGEFVAALQAAARAAIAQWNEARESPAAKDMRPIKLDFRPPEPTPGSGAST